MVPICSYFAAGFALVLLMCTQFNVCSSSLMFHGDADRKGFLKSGDQYLLLKKFSLDGCFQQEKIEEGWCRQESTDLGWKWLGM